MHSWRHVLLWAGDNICKAQIIPLDLCFTTTALKGGDAGKQCSEGEKGREPGRSYSRTVCGDPRSIGASIMDKVITLVVTLQLYCLSKGKQYTSPLVYKMTKEVWIFNQYIYPVAHCFFNTTATKYKCRTPSFHVRMLVHTEETLELVMGILHRKCGRSLKRGLNVSLIKVKRKNGEHFATWLQLTHIKARWVASEFQRSPQMSLTKKVTAL